jgi:hypothetical protein
MRESVTSAVALMSTCAEKDTMPWAPWSSYPIGRVPDEDPTTLTLARTVDDWHGAVIASDYSTFLSIARTDIIPQLSNLATLMTSIDRSVFVYLPFIKPDDENLFGFLLNLNDVDHEPSAGVTVIPFYGSNDPTRSLLYWANVTIKDLFNPSTIIFPEKIDGIARVALSMWALAAWQNSRGMHPIDISGQQMRAHIVQHPSTLIRNN